MTGALHGWAIIQEDICGRCKHRKSEHPDASRCEHLSGDGKSFRQCGCGVLERGTREIFCVSCGALNPRRGHSIRCAFGLLRLRLLCHRTLDELETVWARALAECEIGDDGSFSALVSASDERLGKLALTLERFVFDHDASERPSNGMAMLLDIVASGLDNGSAP